MSRIICFLALLFVGCGISTGLGTIPREALEAEATLAPVTKTEKLLRSLPAPRTPVAVAVYEFVDYTGQNKPGEIPQYSRAVTQGGLAMLKKALLDAGEHRWFRVVERGGINHLLNERKIIRSMRADYVTADGRRLPPLGPLTYAGVILEGGITSYESNVATGGLGARYLGIGGSTSYSRDMVTVYLRAVSVTTGEVLLSVSTSKTVYSIGLSGGLFKFVAYDKLVESESGVTYNEPPQLAVRQAIEMAVYSLVLEGSKSKLWSMSNPAEQQMVYNRYEQSFKDPSHGEIKPGDSSPVMLASASPSPLSQQKPVETSRSERLQAGPSVPSSGTAPLPVIQAPPPSLSVEGNQFANQRPEMPTVREASTSGTTPQVVQTTLTRPLPKPVVVPQQDRLPPEAVSRRPAAWYIEVPSSGQGEREKLLHTLSSSGFKTAAPCASADNSSCKVAVGPYATYQLAERVMRSFSHIFGSVTAELVHRE